MKKLIYSSAVSASINIVVVTVVTIWAELAPAFKNNLAAITGHHWITKSFLVIILFPVILGLMYKFSPREITDKKIAQSLWVLIAATGIGFVAILGFFLWHFFR